MLAPFCLGLRSLDPKRGFTCSQGDFPVTDSRSIATIIFEEGELMLMPQLIHSSQDRTLGD
jgi:hypothetical protein